MAKLAGPLFSLSASGKIAGTLVYSVWKGIKYARQLVIPTNPKSAAQQTQRGILTTALAKWHDVTYILNALDKSNLNRLAGVIGSSMSGFNVYVKQWIDTVIAGVTPVQIYDTVEGAPGAAGIVIDCNTVVSTVAMYIRWGTSKTSMPDFTARDEGEVTPGVAHTFTLVGLSASTRYYYQIYQSTALATHTMGIGQFDTTA